MCEVPRIEVPRDDYEELAAAQRRHDENLAELARLERIARLRELKTGAEPDDRECLAMLALLRNYGRSTPHALAFFSGFPQLTVLRILSKLLAAREVRVDPVRWGTCLMGGEVLAYRARKKAPTALWRGR